MLSPLEDKEEAQIIRLVLQCGKQRPEARSHLRSPILPKANLGWGLGEGGCPVEPTLRRTGRGGDRQGALLPLSSCEGSWWKRGSGALGKEGRIPAPTVGARGMQGPGAGAGRQGRGPETRWAPTLIGQVSKPGAERRVSRPRSACQAGPGLLGEQEKGQTGAALGTAWRPGGPGVIHRGGSSWGSGASGPLLPLQTWLLCPRRSGRTQPVPSVLRPLPCLSRQEPREARTGISSPLGLQRRKLQPERLWDLPEATEPGEGRAGS